MAGSEDFIGAEVISPISSRVLIGQHSLGPRSAWPAAVATTLDLILRSPLPIATLWGAQGILIYNEACAVLPAAGIRSCLEWLCAKGCRKLGTSTGQRHEGRARRGAHFLSQQGIHAFEGGAPERVWLNLDCSPVVGPTAAMPIGVMAVIVETTEIAACHATLARKRRTASVSRHIGKGDREKHRCRHHSRRHHPNGWRTSWRFQLRLCRHGSDEDGFTIRGDWAAPGAMHIVGHYSLADFGKLAVKDLGAGRPLVINDNIKELAPEEAATFQSIGIGATICMPLVKEGRLTALMAIHHKGPHVWTDNELALITEVTERSWAHIERVRSEAEVRDGEQRFREELERQVAERTAALQQSEKTIRTIFETSYMNQGLLTTEGKIVYVNTTSLASIASRFEDVVGKNFWETPWFAGTPGMPEKVREGVERVARGESIQIAMPLNMPTGKQNL